MLKIAFETLFVFPPLENTRNPAKYFLFMSKWANYGISAVRFDPQHTKVEKVIAQLDLEEIFGTPSEYARHEIVAALKRNFSFVTIFTREDGKWKKGQLLRIANINGAEYLKTADDGRAVDNLENLPSF